jgi:N-acetyl-beta-hexosaminidase
LGVGGQVEKALAKAGLNVPGELGREGYLLCVTPKQILLAANDAPGVFYGIQTLKQLIRAHAGPKHAIPACQIVDWPVLAMRGWQDDISRGPIPTLDYLKREIRTMAEYKGPLK